MHNTLRPQYDIYEDYIKYYLQNISYRKHCPCSGNRSFVYSVVPSPTGHREKKAMTDLEYDVSLRATTLSSYTVQNILYSVQYILESFKI